MYINMDLRFRFFSERIASDTNVVISDGRGLRYPDEVKKLVVKGGHHNSRSTNLNAN